MKINSFKDILKKKIHEFIRFVYRVTKTFFKEEICEVVSQIRRAVLSVMLNYVEGYARRKPKVQLNFYEMAYGSFKETKYLLFFSKEEGYISNEEYSFGLQLADEIGAMLWTEIDALEQSIENKKHEE